MRKAIILSSIAILLVFVLTPVALADSNIHFSINPTTMEGEVGNTIVIPLAIQSLPDGLNENTIITFGVVVDYDSNYLELITISPGDIGQAADFDSNYSLDPTNFDQQQGKVIISYSTTGSGLNQVGEFYELSFKLLERPANGSASIILSQRTTPDGTAYDSAYNAYASSFTGAVITIDETAQDNTPPVLSNVTVGNILQGTAIVATSNETGTICLVPASTNNTKNDVLAASQSTNGMNLAVSAGVSVSFNTTGILPDSYVVYALDSAGNLSASSATILISQLVVDSNIHFAVNPSTITAEVGDTIVVPLAIQSLPDGLNNNSIITFGLVVDFDPSCLEVVGVSPGVIGVADDFDSNYSLDTANFDQQQGKVVISYSVTGEGLTQTGTFYNISFRVLSKPVNDSTLITLSKRVQPDGVAFDSQYTAYPASYHNGIITIEEVLIDECFIATASFGSKFQPAVVLLRQFRDNYLLTNAWGKAFVNFYYRNSPPIAAFIAQSEPLKGMVRGILYPIVGVVYVLYHPLWAMVVIALLMIVPIRHIRRKRMNI